ncbi:MAG: TonB-dependent receptor [Prevotella sp.]|nr:TonB-dependent receptor [Prevotella sp.]
MKKNLLWLAGLAIAMPVQAQHGDDSLRLEQLQEVVVKGVRAQQNAPFAVSNIKKQALQAFSKTGRELPFLFAMTPGVIGWSENGTGVGTSHLRIRGAADSRINVTLDGVALNSPEDQCVFWANMNSYAALLGSAQIQRGVGTSTNGDGAFGGTVALSTAAPSDLPSLELTGSYGSLNTFNVGTRFSTGLLWNHLIFDGAYHETNTDGFMHGTKGRSGSYYGGLTWLGDNFTIRYKNIGNFEKTGQAWYGITAGDDGLSLMDGSFGTQTGIRTYADIYERGLGRYNSLYERLLKDDNGAFLKDASGNYLTARYQLRDGSYWDKTTDNFYQNHNILSAAWNLNPHWTTNLSLHYTYGYGYYREFRYNNKLAKFGLHPFTLSDGSTLKRTDFVRKKGLSQNTYGLIWNANYKDEYFDIIGGLSLQQFRGNHFGYLTYVGNAELEQKLLANGDYKYYDSDARKNDYSAFIKATFRLTDHWDAFADLQYRHVGYETDGINDKFFKDLTQHKLDINERYNFFNPKAGFNFHAGPHRAYASVAVSHREPERNNFTDNGNYPAPKAESLTDFELGYQYGGSNWRAGLNLYYMDYKDQFVQTGAENDIGEKLTTNIKDSYRAGAEIVLGWDPFPFLTIEGNAALSLNKIKDFDEVVEDWDAKSGIRTIHYDNSTLAFSPSAILNGIVNFHYRGFSATWHEQYVSRQYMDNTENKDRSLPGYNTSSLNLNYTFKCRKVLKEVVLGVNMDNIFNKHYAAGGWVYSAISESGGHPNDNRYYQLGFMPMAGFTALGNITLKF